MGKKDKILESFEVNGVKYTYKDKYTTEEIRELKAKREALRAEMEGIQEKINEATMAMYEVPDFIGKYVDFSNDDEKSIVRVESVQRLSYGVRVHGCEIFLMGNESYGIWRNGSKDITWSDLKSVRFATEKDCATIKNEIIRTIEKDYEEGFRV